MWLMTWRALSISPYHEGVGGVGQRGQLCGSAEGGFLGSRRRQLRQQRQRAGIGAVDSGGVFVIVSPSQTPQPRRGVG